MNVEVIDAVTPAMLRGVLFHAICGVLKGQVSVPQANAAAQLSAEVHKSIHWETDKREYINALPPSRRKALSLMLGE